MSSAVVPASSLLSTRLRISLLKITATRLAHSRAPYHDPRVLIAARSILGLSHPPTDLHQLRQAYLKAVKNCHPDLQHQHPNKATLVQQFRQVQQSYEMLLFSFQPALAEERSESTSTSSTSNPNGAGQQRHVYRHKLNEQEYRDACQEWLNISAETVEESLKCDMFQQWLLGKSDAAYHWRTFLQMYPHPLSHFTQQRNSSHPSNNKAAAEQAVPLRRRKT